jgi:cell division cycle 20-like protein 1 (cofactor of APC complex)
MGDRSQDAEAAMSRGGRVTRGAARAQAAANMVSPPASTTPPSIPAKKTIFYQDNLGTRPQPDEEGSEPVDPDALTKALKDMEDAGRQRERTPGMSPCRKRQRVYGDR